MSRTVTMFLHQAPKTLYQQLVSCSKLIIPLKKITNRYSHVMDSILQCDEVVKTFFIKFYIWMEKNVDFQCYTFFVIEKHSSANIELLRMNRNNIQIPKTMDTFTLQWEKVIMLMENVVNSCLTFVIKYEMIVVTNYLTRNTFYELFM